MMPLFTMLSITGVASSSADAASACLPALSASVALRMALRSCEVSASFRARCAVDCGAAFSADFVFATRDTPLNEPRSLPLDLAVVNSQPQPAREPCYSGATEKQET